MRFRDSEIMDAMLKSWMGEKPEFPELQTVELNERHLLQLTGEYESEELSMEIEIGLEDGRLTARTENQPVFPPIATDMNRFELLDAGAVLEFSGTDDSPYKQFILHQDGGEYTFIRK